LNSVAISITAVAATAPTNVLRATGYPHGETGADRDDEPSDASLRAPKERDRDNRCVIAYAARNRFTSVDFISQT
jgi:hypothetical protein